MDRDLAEIILAIGVGLFAMMALFATVLLAQIQRDIRLIRTLIAAFMEHKVAPTVAENKLAAAVEEANKLPAR